jgi:galactose mutarotase-like enzyme
MKYFQLENEFLHLSFLPEIGGKITSMRHKHGGREWLWSNPHLPYQQPSYGDSYIAKLDSGGWDEIFPSVSPYTFMGLSIPDHGYLVGIAWDIEQITSSDVTMSARTRFADCHFQRTLRLVEDVIHVSYRLQNHSSSTVPYLWCAHPLIAVEAGMRISLPSGTPMINRGGNGVDFADFTWPMMSDGKSLDMIPHPGSVDFQAYAIKMFTAAQSISEVTIISADGRESLLWQWNPVKIPHLGLWLNVMGWSGCGSPPYFNLGIEPTTAAHDSLNDAQASGSARHLLPGLTHEWEMTTRITCKPNSA